MSHRNDLLLTPLSNCLLGCQLDFKLEELDKLLLVFITISLFLLFLY